MTTPDQVLGFWFGEQTDPAAISRDKSALWWGKSPETDRDIRQRFGVTLERAARGDLDAWTNTAAGTVALILVLDQFSRVIDRDKPGMFANDAKARALSLQLIESGRDLELPAMQRAFATMPLMHAEELALQDLGVERFRRLAADMPESERAPFQAFHQFAIRHRDIVARFGRFPHRNATLGRTSSAEELEFLLTPGSSF